MKLYTKLQVSEAMTLARLTDDSTGDIFKQLTPIELPSDEEIVSTAYADRAVDYCEQQKQIGFEDGAKWLKDKILNQNK